MNHVDTTGTNQQTILSYCTGYGGIEKGIARHIPVRVAAYLEIEAYAVANLAAKIEAGEMAPAPIWTDIKTFDPRPFRGKIHGIIGGYPCQPFSCAGQRKGTEDPRHLWPYIQRHIEAIEPLWCFFENVGQHLTLGFDEVYKSLRDLGYTVEAGLFTAAEVGAPHKRERLFILAYADNGRSGEDWWEGQLRANGVKQSLGDTGSAGARKGEQIGPSCYLWPAGPGPYQHPWEHPRTVADARRATSGKENDGRKEHFGEGMKFGNSIVQEVRNWATPTAVEMETAPEIVDERAKRLKERHGSNTGNGCGYSLGTQIQQWPTPVNDPGTRTTRYKQGGLPLSMAAGGKLNPDWEEQLMGLPYNCTQLPEAWSEGYDTRKDRIRMIGNGVVPQVAEKAWAYLWDRMLKNFS